MEFSNLDSITDVESDRTSFIATEQITHDEERLIAVDSKEYPIPYPPKVITPQISATESQTKGVDFYQCSGTKHDNESGSDSAEEEQSPDSSTETLKYEAFAPSGKQQTKDNWMIRKRPTIQQSLNTHSTGGHGMPYTLQHGLGQEIHGQILPGQDEDNHKTEAFVPTGTTTEASFKKAKYVQRYPKMFEDIDIRLATFFDHAVEWPHENPSPEKIYDLVECYKCGKTLYGFTKDDDPEEEHRKYYPHCQ